jgi:hypothetical protein
MVFRLLWFSLATLLTVVASFILALFIFGGTGMNQGAPTCITPCPSPPIDPAAVIFVVAMPAGVFAAVAWFMFVKELRDSSSKPDNGKKKIPSYQPEKVTNPSLRIV